MEGRRVVITGMGAVTSLGSDRQKLWNKLMQGESGIGRISEYDPSDLPVQIAGTVNDFDVSAYLSAKEARKLDPFIHYALAAAGSAIDDAQLDIANIEPARAACCIGSGIGGISTIAAQHEVFLRQGAKRVSPFFISGSISNMASGIVSIHFGFKGPNYSMVTACASGSHSIGIGSRMIRYGDADVVLAGGAEKASGPLGMSAFSAARALSKRNDSPAEASRPWDKARDGFVMADGAGVLLLESLEHARARNAPILAELVGFGASSDAYHITAPEREGAGAVLAMSTALQDARLKPSEIDYINAHGTSTQLGDTAEVVAIKSTFGDGAQRLVVSSTKSMLGHMLGAAGAVEAIISVSALLNQQAPPTINLHEPDEGCDLDFVPHVGRDMPINAVMSNSFGFGGTNSALIMKRWSE